MLPGRYPAILLVSLFLTFAASAMAQQNVAPRIEVGPEINSIYLPTGFFGSVNYQIGLGGAFAFNFNRFLGLDGSISITPTSPSTGSSNAGGRLTQLNIGGRVGVSKRRFALYAKVRPGFASFGNVIRQINVQTFQFTNGRLTEPSLDVGGIVQFNLSKRFALRYEAGDTLIHYGSRTIIVGTPAVPAQTSNNFEFGIGFMFRFH